MTPSRVPVTSEGPALAPTLAFAVEVVSRFDGWLSENEEGAFLGADDAAAIVAFFLDGDRPHRVAPAVALAAGVEPSSQALALQYGPGSTYRGKTIPPANVALDTFPYGEVWALRCAQVEDAGAEGSPMSRALDAYSSENENETPFCPKLDQREED